MTTPVLPLTEDEERALLRRWKEGEGYPDGAWERTDVLRLLATLDAERARRAPPHSRSDARRIAAQRGEPAPVFDEPLNEYEEQALRLAPANTYTSSDLTKLWDTIDLLRRAPHYPASVVEAVRALEEGVKSLATLDCGDNSCLFKTTKGGMRTNGGCRCGERGTGISRLGLFVREMRAALASLPKELRDAAGVVDMSHANRKADR